MAPILRAFVALACALLATATTHAFAYGEDDPSYAGAVLNGWECPNSQMAPLPDESVFFQVRRDAGRGGYGVAKALADGTYDPAWQGGVAPIASTVQGAGALLAPLALPDGGVIVVGPMLQRLRRDGSIDTSYGTNGLSDPVGSIVMSAALQADGSVMVLAYAQIGMGISYDYLLRRILPNGKLDKAFGGDGFLDLLSNVSFASLYAWSVKNDGTVEAGYSHTDGNGNLVPELHRYPVDFTDADRPRGRIMPRAGVASWVAPNVLVDGAGGAVFAVATTDAFNLGQVMLERFLPDGTVDRGFGLQLVFPRFSYPRTTTPTKVKLWRSANGGWTVHLTQVQDYGFPSGSENVTFAIRFGADGRLDPAFAKDLLVYGGGVRLNDGRMLSQREFGGNGSRDCQLVRWLTDGEPRVDGIMVEYFHPGLRHYFMTLDTFEAAGLDAVPYGWVRTGRTFAAWQPVPAPATTPVCRFYGDPVIGPNSHFYTPEGYECDGLVALEHSTPPGIPVWHLEGKPFRASLPDADGTCPGNLDPVYRVFNGPVDNANGPTHRYTTDPGLYAQMQALGWLPEGAHFCVPPLGPR
jgi:hypothetical protein